MSRSPRPKKPPVDCADEPIHLSGAIQPHGWLLSCDPADWTIRHLSANVADLFELEPDELLGSSLREHIDGELVDALATALPTMEPGLAARFVAAGNLGPTGRYCDLTAHVQQGLVHVEIEANAPARSHAPPVIDAQRMIAGIAQLEVGEALFERAAALVRELTGYDRVMVYRFRDDDAGEVVAEARADDVEPYLGLRFPATDIPAQARRLYLYNRVRVIPDGSYRPVPILPAAKPPLDLSQHVLRSVSPVHLEYLANMGVTASMSISIITGARLWGLFACHHRNPRRVPAALRAIADLFGMYVSMRVTGRLQDLALQRSEAANRLADRLRARLGEGGTPHAAITAELPAVVELLRGDGALLVHGDGMTAAGTTPPEALLPALSARAATAGGVVADDAAEAWLAEPAAAAGIAGVLTIPLGERGDALHVFRREQVEDVSWAGEPHKALIATDDGTRLAPRRSFRTWRETVRGRCLAWSGDDRDAAARVQRLLADVARQREADA
ncbi:GAF domain-containing protein [Arenimonas composti]|uniref:Phytochrome chromophore attachment site domain-containing protein n=1 Tax=Arenimonas composti TR7-09 = DSM 18010 TaxID=1121013 RepID=A0A091BCZ5_9GAMM|nr:GAF domain-containing protein [Arenimonas composti]KFN48704.1 hypothetical protein P873_13690 [Arenimonas composti TR7-09 = DSM 18010]